jgi:hypothetical protein
MLTPGYQAAGASERHAGNRQQPYPSADPTRFCRVERRNLHPLPSADASPLAWPVLPGAASRLNTRREANH